MGDTKSQHTLFQISVIDSLKHNVEGGSVTAGDMLQIGDTGFGTSAFPGGEMVVSGGAAWLGRVGDGVVQLSGDTAIPFAFLTNFSRDFSAEIAGRDIEDVKNTLDRVISDNCAGMLNYFCMVRIGAVFPSLNVRTTLRVRTDDGVISRRQCTEFADISGTVIGLRCPSYAERLNQPGWHFHFLSDDRLTCGHLIDFAVGTAESEFDILTRWEIILPETDEFRRINFA